MVGEASNFDSIVLSAGLDRRALARLGGSLAGEASPHNAQGFALAPSAAWQTEPKQPRGESLDEAKNALDKALEAIEGALKSASPEDAAALNGQRENLSALRAQMSNGFVSGASVAQLVQQIQAAAATATSAAATVASGGSISGGGMSAERLAAFEQQYGLRSISEASSYAEAREILAENFNKLTPVIDDVNDKLLAKGLMSEHDAEEIEKKKKAAQTGDPAAVAAYVDAQRAVNDKARANTTDPDVIKGLDTSDDALDVMSTQSGLTAKKATSQVESAEAAASYVTNKDTKITKEIDDSRAFDEAGNLKIARDRVDANVKVVDENERLGVQVAAAASTRGRRNAAAIEPTPVSSEVAANSSAPVKAEAAEVTSVSLVVAEASVEEDKVPAKVPNAASSSTTRAC